MKKFLKVSPLVCLGIGERIKVTYYSSRGHNVGYQVEIDPAPPSPPPPPPPKKK
jgi:hypothetical protein